MGRRGGDKRPKATSVTWRSLDKQLWRFIKVSCIHYGWFSGVESSVGSASQMAVRIPLGAPWRVTENMKQHFRSFYCFNIGYKNLELGQITTHRNAMGLCHQRHRLDVFSQRSAPAPSFPLRFTVHVWSTRLRRFTHMFICMAHRLSQYEEHQGNHLYNSA